MSLVGFDTLRVEHPNDRMLIDRLEDAVRSILRRNPHAVLDEKHLAQITDSAIAQIELFLVDLLKFHAIESRVAWVCPIRHGTSLEARHLKELPLLLECRMCGQEHEYDPAQVEVFFIPSETLLRSVSAET